jgi:hypothetical protein
MAETKRMTAERAIFHRSLSVRSRRSAASHSALALVGRANRVRGSRYT